MSSTVFYLDSKPDYTAPDVSLAKEAFKEINLNTQNIKTNHSAVLKEKSLKILQYVKDHDEIFKEMVIALEADLINENIEGYNERLKELKFAMSDTELEQEDKESIETDIESIMEIIHKRLNAVEDKLFKEHKKQTDQLSRITQAENALKQQLDGEKKESNENQSDLKAYYAIQKASDIYIKEYDRFVSALSYFQKQFGKLRKKHDTTVSEFEGLFKKMVTYLNKIKKRGLSSQT